MPMFHETKPLAHPPPKDGKSSGGASGSGVSTTQAAKEKAQARRAQVRKAQIQHRQRKANYVKELELDIVQVREMIAEAERESRRLRTENATIRQKLTHVAATAPVTRASPRIDLDLGLGLGLGMGIDMGGMPPPAVPGRPQSLGPTGTGFPPSSSSGPSPVFSPGMQLPPSAATTSFFSDPGLDDITVTLQMDEAMNYPCFQFKRNSSPSSGGWDGGSSGGAPSPPSQQFQQSQQFGSNPPQQQLGSSPPPQPPPQPPQQQRPGSSVPGLDLTPEQTDQAINFILALEHICWGHFHAGDYSHDDHHSGRESAHTLMATSIALAPAPPQVFKKLGKSQRNVWFTPSALNSNPISGDISWKSGGLSLQSLYGLAASLNPGDRELTPVQAWFELARTFDVELLLNPIVADGLKRELHGVVKCVHYGAAIERAAFASVVGRVIGGFLGVDPLYVPGIDALGAGGGPGFGDGAQQPHHQQQQQQQQQQPHQQQQQRQHQPSDSTTMGGGAGPPGHAISGPSTAGGMI